MLDTVKAKKLAYYGRTMMTQGSCLEKTGKYSVGFLGEDT